MTIERKRWAQRAQALRLEQLAAIRSRAEQWRNGLVGLTALLGVAAVVKGPEVAADLSADARSTVVNLMTGAFAALVTGSLLAMFAAFGVPGRKQLMTGEALQVWEEREAAKARAAVLAGALVFLGGLVLVGLATRHAALSPGKPDNVISVKARGDVICGSLVSGTDRLRIKRRTEVGSPVVTNVPFAQISELALVEDCPRP